MFSRPGSSVPQSDFSLALLRPNNLSDLDNPTTARANLGLSGAPLNLTRPRRIASRFYDYAFSGVGTLRAVVFGDSLANNLPQFFLRYLDAQLGHVDGIDAPPSTASTFTTDYGYEILAGTFTTDPADGYTYWPTGPLNILTASSRVKWTYAGVNPTFTRAKVYYIKEPGAGTFSVIVGGVTVATVNASNSTVALGVYEIVQSSAQALLELLRVTGTTRIIGVTNSGNETGVRAANVSVGGLSLADAMSSAQCRAIFTAFLADYAPDLFTWEMDDVTADDLTLLGDVLDAGSAVADKIFIAPNPTAAEPDSTTRRDALAVWCGNRNSTYFFFDGWTPISPYQTLVNLGWEGDGAHPSIACNAHLAALLISNAGLDAFVYALRSKPVNAMWAPSFFGRNSAFYAGDDRLTVESDATFGYDWAVKFGRTLEFWTRGLYGTANAFIARFSGNVAYKPNVLPGTFNWNIDASTRKVQENTSGGFTQLEFVNTDNTNNYNGDDIRLGSVQLLAYTKTTMPTSNNRPWVIIMVTNGAADGTACLAYSKGEAGTTWRRVSDDVIIS